MTYNYVLELPALVYLAAPIDLKGSCQAHCNGSVPLKRALRIQSFASKPQDKRCVEEGCSHAMLSLGMAGAPHQLRALLIMI